MTTVLLVEDNTDLLENTAEILELANYNVIKAENGKVALEKIRDHKKEISIIVCDVMMPELDGYGVLKALDNMEDMKRVPFVFLTAKTEKVDFRKGMNLGADDYLTKPFTSEELLGLLAARLKKTNDTARNDVKDAESFSQLITASGVIKKEDLLRRKFRVKQVRRKETLFNEGDETAFLYYVLRGKIKSSKTNDQGKEYIFNIYTEGDFLGYSSLLDNGVHEDTAMAMEDCEVAILSRQNFYEMIYSSKEIYARFMKKIAASLHEAERKLPNVAYNSARKKVAEALVFLAKKHYGYPGDLSSFSVSRDDLSAISGIAPESISRNLTEFRQEKLIDVREGKLVILNYKKLEGMKN